MLNPQFQDAAKGLNQQQIHQIKTFFTSCMWELAKCMRLRSPVAATATAYFRKFYTRNSLCSWDPQLMHVGCLFLASKAEESSVAATTLVYYAKKLQPTWPFDTTHVLDSEMVILQSLDFRLALLSPFQPLAALTTDAGVPQKTAHRAWAVLNDSYYSDAPILYPPQLLALGCLVFAAAMDGNSDGQQQQQQQEQQQTTSCSQEVGPSSTQGINSRGPPVPFPSWLQGLQVDLGMVYAVVEELAVMYDTSHKRLSADECARLLTAAGVKAECMC